MFKKISLVFAVFALLLIGAAVLVYADNPYTETVTLTAGSGSYENTKNYQTMELISLEIFNSLAATSTVTVTRVRSGRTNTVAAIALSGGAGIYRETNSPNYLFKGDVLNFVNSTATGAVAEITVKLHP